MMTKSPANKVGAFSMDQLLGFSKANAKLDMHVGLYTFYMPAGHSCPFAKACKSSADRETGKVTDGPYTEFRCFGATTEARLSNVRNKAWRNYDALTAVGLKNENMMTELIEQSLNKVYAKIIRIHSTGGDYLTREYMNAWSNVARNNPQILFYGYTKAIHFMLQSITTRPHNHRMVASYGGVHDKLIDKHKLPKAVVVNYVDEAEDLGLEIDHDDSHAMAADHDFALLIHGTQPAGSKAAKAVYENRQNGWTGYSKKKNKAKNTG
jgi:hypothetical protein